MLVSDMSSSGGIKERCLWSAVKRSQLLCHVTGEKADAFGVGVAVKWFHVSHSCPGPVQVFAWTSHVLYLLHSLSCCLLLIPRVSNRHSLLWGPVQMFDHSVSPETLALSTSVWINNMQELVTLFKNIFFLFVDHLRVLTFLMVQIFRHQSCFRFHQNVAWRHRQYKMRAITVAEIADEQTEVCRWAGDVSCDIPVWEVSGEWEKRHILAMDKLDVQNVDPCERVLTWYICVRTRQQISVYIQLCKDFPAVRLLLCTVVQSYLTWEQGFWFCGHCGWQACPR